MRSSSPRTAPATGPLLPILILFLVSIGVVGPLRAAEPPSSAWQPGDAPPDTLRLRWTDVVGLLERHPAPGMGRWNVAAAEAAARAAGTLPNPALDASLTREEGAAVPGERPEWEAGLTLPLGWLAQRGHAVRAARERVEVGKEEERALRLDALAELRVLFWDLVCEQARATALDTLRQQTAELARLVARRVERGEARPAEATRMEIELERVEGERDLALAMLGARRGRLGLWIDGAGRELVAEAELGDVPGSPALDPALARVRARHPGLAAARARVRVLEAEAGLERRARVPDLEVRGFVAREHDADLRGAGIGLQLPLWDWRSGRVAEARARVEAGRRRLEWETRQAESGLVEAQAAARASRGLMERYRDRILPRAESAAAVMERTWRLGEAGLLELIDARRVLVETRLRYLDALAQAQRDYSRLVALAGTEDTP